MHQQLRNWITSQLNTVPNIGTVHSYQRYADREKQLADLYFHNGRLHGWFVQRASVAEKLLNSQANSEQSFWSIVGYLAVNDTTASELEFDTLLDAMRAVFRVAMLNPVVEIAGQAVNLSYTEQAVKAQIGFAVLDSQPVLFAGVLCHSARCQLITDRSVVCR
ncbi:MAG: hypothetical protein NTW85_06540 [Methylococcales bacterium]|nr:hypothetical protein [Methylococcales bacterium]